VRRGETKMSDTKPVIGDVCEIKTPRGLGYVQYTHDGKHRAIWSGCFRDCLAFGRRTSLN